MEDLSKHLWWSIIALGIISLGIHIINEIRNRRESHHRDLKVLEVVSKFKEPTAQPTEAADENIEVRDILQSRRAVTIEDLATRRGLLRQKRLDSETLTEEECRELYLIEEIMLLQEDRDLLERTLDHIRAELRSIGK